ncbi:enoyl-CoA hydratase-related protein, partial [Dyadobacter sp. CY312]|uniref:enoyl-CoA hydratase-related protein n=1 Tax=Dyadobacter sp. CY312 TaxID=2907303 RepID=UPI001F340A57
GAGASLALACDVVIASESAYLSQIFVRIGLMPDAGATFLLPRLIGMAKAFEIASTGRNVYAPEAAQIGMINRAVPENELDAAVDETVAYYRNAPTKAIGTMKAVLNQSYQSDLGKMLELEALNQDALSKTHDAAEGIMSFIQKRKPDYQGK